MQSVLHGETERPPPGQPLDGPRAFEQAQPVLADDPADDVLDAIVAAWSAGRIATGQGGRLPETAVFGAGGLRMEIAY